MVLSRVRFGCMLLALCWTRHAGARGLDYRAVDGCPEREVVLARLASGGSGARDVRIEIQRADAGFRGEVLVGDGDDRLVRSVEARTCPAVIEALALVVALDQQDRDGEADQGQPATEPQHVRTETVRPSPAPDERATTPLTPRRLERTSGLVGALGGAVQTTSFANGKMLSGASLFGEIAADTGIAGQWWLRPSARATLFWSTTMWTERGGVEPDFTVRGGSLDVCERAPWGEPTAVLSICSRTEIGSLVAGAAGDSASSRSRWWLASGGAGRARVVFSRHSRVRPMIEVTAGFLVPLIRDRFHFPGHDTIVASRWLWTASIGGGIELR